MMQQPFKFALLCIAGCLALVFILYAFADKPNSNKNGFTRRIPPVTAVLRNSLVLKYPAYYIAGYSNRHIYLGNYSASLHLLAVKPDPQIFYNQLTSNKG